MHFTQKAQIWDAIKAQGFTSCTAIEPAFFFQNFAQVPFVSFTKKEDGTAAMKFPVLSETDKIAAFDPDDTGRPQTTALFCHASMHAPCQGLNTKP